MVRLRRRIRSGDQQVATSRQDSSRGRFIAMECGHDPPVSIPIILTATAVGTVVGGGFGAYAGSGQTGFWNGAQAGIGPGFVGLTAGGACLLRVPPPTVMKLKWSWISGPKGPRPM